MRKKGIAIVCFCCLVFGPAMVFGKGDNETYRIVFSTFDSSSAGKSAYLRDGIQNMLASRLAAKDRVVVLDRTLSDKELKSLKSGQRPDPGGAAVPPADYLVAGSLYDLKGGLSIQVVLYPFATDREIVRLEALVKNPDNLLADVGQLSEEIAQSAFGYTAVAAGSSEAAGQGGGVAGFVTAHPEAAYKKGQYTGTIIGATGGSVRVAAREGKQNITMDRDIRTMAVADLDGDGQDEIAVLLENGIELYKSDGKKIERVGKASLPSSVDSHALNIADLDRNGHMEIYVSGTDGLEVSSMIMTWTREKGFQVLAENIPWYIRPVLIPGKGWRLAGQKRGFEKVQLVKAGVYLLDIGTQQAISAGEQLPLPEGVNLFDFVFADLDGDGIPETVAIDKKERMKIFNQANELLWVSKKTFGGSQIYIGPSRGEAVNKQDRRNFSADEDFERELIFVPGRLVVADVDNDGRQEIVVSENTLSAVSIYSRLRIYNDGMVVGMAWDGSALHELWRTGTFRGYIAGYGFSLKDKAEGARKVLGADGKNTIAGLYVGHLPRSGSLLGLLPGTAETQLTAYELEFSYEKTQ